jgi:hypothetical protein
MLRAGAFPGKGRRRERATPVARPRRASCGRDGRGSRGAAAPAPIRHGIGAARTAAIAVWLARRALGAPS